MQISINMRYFIKSVGLSLGLGIVCSILMIIFIEGWGTYITLLVTIASFGFAGYFIGKTRPASSLYAGIFISLPIIIGMSPKGSDLKLILELLSAPSKIDFRNFYVFLSPIALLTSYIGTFIGYHFSKRKK
jgi:hypothetical protein